MVFSSLEPSPQASISQDATPPVALRVFEDVSDQPLDALPGPQECPVSIVFNDTSYATILASPEQLESLAIGFAFSEGVIDRYADIESLDCEPSRHGMRVKLGVSRRIARRAESQSRATQATSACGACGVREESQLLFGLTWLPSTPLPSPEVVAAGLETLKREAVTGMHLALGLAADGEILSIGRDIGRHNALDKVIGTGLAADAMPELIMTSSRCSLELVQKSVRARVSALATLSYPSRLAVEVARSCHLTLINCHRGRRLELLSRGDD